MSSPEKPSSRSLEDGVRIFLLKETLLGSIYFKYFKRFKVVRGLVLLSWRLLLPVGLRLYFRFRKKNLRRVPLRRLADVAKIVETIAPQHKIIVSKLSVFPKKRAQRCPVPYESFVFPSLYLGLLENQVVRGGSNFIIGPHAVVHHDLFQVAYDYTSEELHGRMMIKPKTQEAFILSHAEGAIDEIAEAASFTDAVASNYAHFITEILPRLHMFVRHAPKHVPLIIDAALHPNFFSAIYLVVGPERPLIRLEFGRSILVRKLWVMSVCGYIPFERRPRSARLPGHSQGMFSPAALRSMRDAIKVSLSIPAKANVNRKIFIRRNSGYRNIYNALEIERCLAAVGFEIVEPEKLSFEQQVILFSSASVVVGATGAAFANLVFCSPGCNLVIMHGEHKCMTYYYWQSIALACGSQITCVLGKISGGYNRSIHSDFHVALGDVLAAVRSSNRPEDLVTAGVR